MIGWLSASGIDAVAVPGRAATAVANPQAVTPATATPLAAGGGIDPVLLGVGVAVLLLGAAVAVYANERGIGTTTAGVGSTTTPEAPPEPKAPEPEDDPADPPSVADDELLSDEDRVVALLEANDGRMRQVKIVEETDWSKSKVSMLLSEMDDAGTISKLRVGRENIISLDGMEPEAAKSPFEDDA
jgi:uncharacterized membrane protein